MRTIPLSVKPFRLDRYAAAPVRLGAAPRPAPSGERWRVSPCSRLLDVKLLASLVLMSGLLVGLPTRAGMPTKQGSHMVPEMLDDATLNDIFFLNSDLGWAVGDRGVILHTEDGGRHWHRQRISTAARLKSVCFIDDRRGWVVGGYLHAYTRRTSCLIARTQDGGATWEVVPEVTFPTLDYVQFRDAQHGWAVGKSCALYPAGVFRTDDGGRSWTTLPAKTSGSWTAGYFQGPKHGVVAGRKGKLAVVRGPRIVASRTPDLGPRPLRALHMRDERHGWLVGDGGLVMQTTDAGLTWQNPSAELPPGVRDHCDFRALSVQGTDVWIAGSPGTVVLHSPDAGNTWEVSRTDHPAPLQAIDFVDRDRGWAAGALGAILATRDGGRTWRRQRVGGTRAALLGVFSEPNRIPLELFAQQSGDQGYLGVAEILTRRDVEVPLPDTAPLEEQAHAALTAVGACGAQQAWRFPARQEGLKLAPNQLIEIWNRAHDGHGVKALEELVVRGIRQWRPEVIVTEAASPRGDRPLAQLVNQIVLSAVTNAGDPTAFPDHASILDLSPWSVKKVFCVAENEEQADVRLTTTQLSTRLGRSLGAQAVDGYAMLNADYHSSPVAIGFRLLHNQLPQAAGRTDIFSGIHLQAGGPARRRRGQPTARDLESLTRAAEKRRNMERVFQSTAGGSAKAAAWLGQVEDLTGELSSSSAGQVLFQLSQRYRKAGRLELASQTLQQLVQQYPKHPLAEKALVWLVRYHASGEIAWQLQRETRFDARVGKAAVVKAGHAASMTRADHRQSPTEHNSATLAAQPASAAGSRRGASPKEPSASVSMLGGRVQTKLKTDRRTTTAGAQFDLSERTGQALRYAKMIQRQRPALFAEPRVQFPMAVAYRAQGLSGDAERFYHRWGATPMSSNWKQCAQAELWLNHGRGVAPKPLYTCRHVTSRPRLDGELEDPVWQQAEQLQLTSAQHDDGLWPAAAMLAWDEQFLFLAASCRKTAGSDYPSASRPRPRDPDLSNHDRVELFIDLDRDYTSFYRLTVDHRGWTGESCMSNRQWNPTWYVASQAGAKEWTIEVAIPWQELTPTAPQRNDAWAMGLHRIAPGTGIQSFTKPAAVKPKGAAFALMVFNNR